MKKPPSARITSAIAAACIALTACSSGSGTLPSAQTPQASNGGARAANAKCNGSAADIFKTSEAQRKRMQTSSPCGLRVITSASAAAAAVHRTRAALAGSSGVISFDIPGAATADQCSDFELFSDCGTNVGAVNDVGNVVGYYLDSTLVPIAFIRAGGGQTSTFDVPGSAVPHAGTSPTVITNGGLIGGFFDDSQFFQQSFIRARDGTFVTYNPSFAAGGSDLASMNSSGAGGGHAYDAQGEPHAYIRSSDGSTVNTDPPDTFGAGVCYTDCFNAGGTTVGNFLSNEGLFEGYIRTPGGSYTLINFPTALGQDVVGVNNGGQVAGFYVDANNVIWSYVRSVTGKLTVFQSPDAGATPGNGTEVLQISNAGATTGLYADVNGALHAFYRSTSGKFAEFDASDLAVETEPTGINNSGEVVGTWFDAEGQSHGFIWMPH